MTDALLAGLVTGCVVLIGEGYVLLGRQARQANVNDQILEAARQLLAVVPGKSAARTDGGDEVPAEHWGRLSEPVTQPQPVVRAVPTDTAEANAVIDAGLADLVAPRPATTTRDFDGRTFTFLAES